MDGWSNLRNEGIINFIVSKPEPVFVKFLLTEENHHTALYLSGEIRKVLEEYNPMKFFVIIADNASDIQAALRILIREFPHLITLNCAAHTLHLLISDLIKIPGIAKIVDSVVNIIKHFRNKQVLRAKLNLQRKKSKKDKMPHTAVSLSLPVATRWGTVRKCLESLLSNKYEIQRLCIEPNSKVQEDKRDLLLDSQFWRQVAFIHELLAPISDLIFQLESDQLVIHKVYPSMKTLQRQLDEVVSSDVQNQEDGVQIRELFMKRKEMLLHPIYYASTILDPTDSGYSLSDDEQIKGMSFINDVCTTRKIDGIVQELADYRSQEGGIWKKSYLLKRNYEPIKDGRVRFHRSFLVQVASVMPFSFKTPT